MHTQPIDWDNLPPEHPVCEALVEVPTLRLQPRGLNYPDRPPEFEGQEEIVVQWFGASRSPVLSKLQFAFPLMTDADDIKWFRHPEWYRIAMLGRLDGWPNKSVLEKWRADGRRDDEIVAYVITSHIGLSDGRGGTVPAAYLIPVVCLGDPTHGVIMPQEFANWDVPKEEVAKLKAARAT